MIIWINGPFGVGKTQTAFELHFRLPGSVVFDPEEIGFMLRRTLPNSKEGDFQDIPLWREFTFAQLRHASQYFDAPIIVPMTVANPVYHQQTVGQLHKAGVQIYHFTLLASRETVLGRLRKRGDNSKSWPAQQIERCLSNLHSEQFAQHINTEGRSISSVAEEIAEASGVNLQKLRNGFLSRTARQLSVQLKHIRR